MQSAFHKMKQKKYLFFATEVGLAHISRTLSIAEELHKRGHKTIFALPKRRWFIFKKTPITFVDIEPYINRESIDIIKIAKNKQALRKIMKNELEVIKKYNPDGLIIDTRITALCGGLIEKKKIFMFGGSNSVPGFAYLPKNSFPKFIYLILKPFSDKVIQFIHKVFFKNIIEITNEYDSSISADKIRYSPNYIIPEAEDYLPIKKTRAKIYYVNLPSWNGYATSSPTWLKNIQPNGKTIYVTFGGTGFDGKKLINIAEKFVDTGYRVIVSTGNLVDESLFLKHRNLFVSKFLPGREVSKRVDLVICHGGYGTLMETIQAGKPVVCIPFNPDQMVQANRITELGLGIVIQHITMKDIMNIFKLDWDKFQESNSRISILEILAATKEVFKNYKYYGTNIKKFNKRFHKIDGAVETADIIERLT